ncbi:MAG: hypothetical protein LBV21_03380 [Candidatus Adiutrix sp.]|jgi:putative RNA 2'-phosphotransferase|nr:hypothetical protein [Candidatus Adiutrix sp.]
MTSRTLQQQDNLEKLLRYVLGRAPDEFGLQPDARGFVPLKLLVAALHDEEGWRGVKEGRIMMLVNQPGDRSPLEEAEGLIRLKPSLAALPPEAPPASALPRVLYGAFKPTAWAVISQRGLYPKAGAEEVRLWSEAEMALKVGRRSSALVELVTVQAVKAQRAGAVFRPYSERLWLTAAVPAVFLSGPPVPPREEEPPSRQSRERAPEAPGSFFPPAVEPEIHQGKKKGKRGDEPDWKNQLHRERRRRDRKE